MDRSYCKIPKFVSECRRRRTISQSLLQRLLVALAPSSPSSIKFIATDGDTSQGEIYLRVSPLVPAQTPDILPYSVKDSERLGRFPHTRHLIRGVSLRVNLIVSAFFSKTLVASGSNLHHSRITKEVVRLQRLEQRTPGASA